MMVKIAILSHGLIHNTKVVLSLLITIFLCSKTNVHYVALCIVLVKFVRCTWP